MSNFIYLVAPLTLLMGVGLAIYLWRTLEAPRRDVDKAVTAEEPGEDEAE